jgi:hypothetical protein
LCIPFLWKSLNEKIQLHIHKIIIVSLVINFSIYLLWRQPLRDWNADFYASFKIIGSDFSEKLQQNNNLICAFDGVVRGDLVYYARRNIIELYSEKLSLINNDASVGNPFNIRSKYEIYHLRYAESTNKNEILVNNNYENVFVYKSNQYYGIPSASIFVKQKLSDGRKLFLIKIIRKEGLYFHNYEWNPKNRPGD